MTVSRPNILLITSDQQRKDSLGVYANGRPARSPHLDAIAADGLVFDRAYTPHATCTPSRASILTGQWGSRHGAYTIGTALDWNCLKVSDCFNDAGYETHAIGKMHFRPVSTEGEYESIPQIFDWNFWKTNHAPYYGFKNLALSNRHSSEAMACGMHYGLWLKEERGLSDADLKKYFNDQPQGRWNLPRELHQSVYVAQKTILAIEQQALDKKPFFIWSSFADPHAPYCVPAPYDDLFDPAAIEHKPYREGEFRDKPDYYQQLYEAKALNELPFSDSIGIPCACSSKACDEAFVRKGAAIHHGMVTLMDEEIGRIVESLKKNGQYENTVIVFATDHGDLLGNHGFWGKGLPAYEEVYNIPFIIKRAGDVQPAYRRNSQLCGLVDIAPTILDMAGLQVPTAMQGVSLANQFSQSPAKTRDSFLIENRLVEKGCYQKILVTERWKLVVYQDRTDGELYDLRNDADQYVNLWSDAKHTQLKTCLLAELIRYHEPAKACPSGVKELLALVSAQMHAEEPVQKRTSFS